MNDQINQMVKTLLRKYLDENSAMIIGFEHLITGLERVRVHCPLRQSLGLLWTDFTAGQHGIAK